MDASFWRDRKVLVTGHTGFKGSWLTIWLRAMGARVVGFSHSPNTDPSMFDVASVGRGIRSITGDIRDLRHLDETVREEEPDVVFHLAAQSLVHHGYDHPVETFESNVLGTVNLLEALRRTPSAQAVVVVTTDKCYENRELRRGYRETDRLGGFDPYSSSKACAELVVSSYRRSYFGGNTGSGLPVASARGGNAIGGGDWAASRLIPDVVRAFIAGEAVSIRRPGAVRPWQHVLELVGGYLLLAEHLAAGGAEYAEAWNFGPSTEHAKPVSWIVEHLRSLWGDGADWTLDGADYAHETGHLSLDSSKAIQRLGWKPRLRLEEALALTLEWYRGYANGLDLRALTEEQIETFSNLMSNDANGSTGAGTGPVARAGDPGP
jgi:CDP-glucose 4,6-dehydratase